MRYNDIIIFIKLFVTHKKNVAFIAFLNSIYLK